MRRIALLLLVVAGLVPAVHADVSLGVHVRVAPGIFVGARWHSVPAWVTIAPAANLAVVDTNIHPKHSRLYLDGRFIGIADDFDGFPDFLYLKPGRYRLECRLGGFGNEVVEIEARAGYRHDLRFHMERVKDAEKEHWWQRPDRPKPVQRVFGPVVAEPLGGRVRHPQLQEATPAGPDLGLRPDLRGSHAEKSSQNVQSASAALQLEVTPAEASVYFDGAFLATGGELAGLAGPLAISAGKHEIEVVAPGHVSVTRQLDAVAGGTVSLRVELMAERGRQE